MSVLEWNFADLPPAPKSGDRGALIQWSCFALKVDAICPRQAESEDRKPEGLLLVDPGGRRCSRASEVEDVGARTGSGVNAETLTLPGASLCLSRAPRFFGPSRACPVNGSRSGSRRSDGSHFRVGAACLRCRGTEERVPHRSGLRASLRSRREAFDCHRLRAYGRMETIATGRRKEPREVSGCL